MTENKQGWANASARTWLKQEDIYLMEAEILPMINKYAEGNSSKIGRYRIK